MPRPTPSDARRITIVDVAQRAGVSTKTVSRVLNGEPHVTAALRERVEAAAAELDYHPNVLAQGLVRRRSYLIGLVYENPSPSYVVELQMGVLERLRAERYRLVVLPVQSVSERAGDVVGLLRAAAVDGVVLSPPASDHPTILDALDRAHLPFARIAPTQLPGRGPRTLLDDVAAARELAEHVLALGHRRIAVVLGDPTHAATQARMTGYRQAFAAVADNAEPLLERGMFTFDSGYSAGQRLCALPVGERPTAILAQNDDMAVGALMAAREAGLDVPRELSIAGFDDSEVARITWPRITTIRQPVFEMAVAATDMLLARLNGEVNPPDRQHAHQLVVRESTTAPVGGDPATA